MLSFFCTAMRMPLVISERWRLSMSEIEISLNGTRMFVSSHAVSTVRWHEMTRCACTYGFCPNSLQMTARSSGSTASINTHLCIVRACICMRGSKRILMCVCVRACSHVRERTAGCAYACKYAQRARARARRRLLLRRLPQRLVKMLARLRARAQFLRRRDLAREVLVRGVGRDPLRRKRQRNRNRRAALAEQTASGALTSQPCALRALTP